MATPDRARLSDLIARERGAYVSSHAKSAAAFVAAKAHLFGGVPMTWMNKAAGGFPLYLDRARGGGPGTARLRRPDGCVVVPVAPQARRPDRPAAVVVAVRRQAGGHRVLRRPVHRPGREPRPFRRDQRGVHHVERPVHPGGIPSQARRWAVGYRVQADAAGVPGGDARSPREPFRRAAEE
mgnify:CR=1 FL=1